MKKDVEAARRLLARLPVHAKAGRPVTPLPAKGDVMRLYVRQGLSLRDAAAALGITKDKLRRTLQAYGIERRTNARRPGLRVYSLDEIEKRVQAGGMKGAAASLGVCLRTLQYYRARLRKQAAKRRKG